MLPSFGSMSMPALVPHCRPAGSSPQFFVTFGVGFGNPSPLMKFADRAGLACSVDAVVPAAISATQAPSAGIRVSLLDMTPPGDRGPYSYRDRTRTSTLPTAQLPHPCEVRPAAEVREHESYS